MAYTFDPIFAADPNNPSVVASNAAILIYNPADTGKAPVTITDSSGSPLSNPITVNKNGFGPAFVHETLDRLAWQGGGFEGYFTSYEGMKNAATDAAAAAQAAVSSAEVAALAASTAASDAVEPLNIQLTKNPDTLIAGAITVDASNLVTSAVVAWPDGSPGTLTITSRDSLGGVLGYNITYGSPVTKTYTQPTITRNAAGAATNVPQIVVS